MRLISLDTETELIARGRQIPPLGLSDVGRAGPISPTPRIKAKGIPIATPGPRSFCHLDDPTVHITGANIGFDILVTSALWRIPIQMAPRMMKQSSQSG